MSSNGSRMIDPMRASTGTVQLSASYDPASASRYPGYPSDVPYMSSSYDPRYARDPRMEAQPISSTTYRDGGHAPKLRTEYAIRPKQRSSTMSVADTHLTPGRYDPFTSRASPVISVGDPRSFSPLPNQERYMVPATTNRHHRDPSAVYTDYSSDTGRWAPRDRHSKARMSYGAYPGYEQNSGKGRYLPAVHGFRKGEDIDDYNAYSYTTPREQFEKESVARLHHERGQHRKERPLSLTGIDYHQLVPKKEHRSLGPPPSQRGFDKLDRDVRVRRSTQGSADSDVDSTGHRRRSRQRTPVHLHQDPDEGYSSYREDHEYRPRLPKRPDEDASSRRSVDDRASRTAPSVREPVASGALVPAGPSEHREHKSRPRRSSRRRTASSSDEFDSDEDLKKYRREPSARRKPDSSTPSASSSDRSSPYLAVERPRRRRSHSRSRPQIGSPQEASEMARMAFCTSPKELEPQPKGILKPPRDKFPEESNPVREGVAPLKDAHKKGIPPGARWTKIHRQLVNPAALEAGRERFEERADYVIVLRVLSKEEIQAYAQKTQEIRDDRYHDYVRERRRRREEDRRRGKLTAEDFSSDDEESDNSPLAIEGSAESKFNSRVSQGQEGEKTKA
ncbi:hypothetical protein FE257_006468 [Aspergillus nanangensis]|uniref:DUF8035 domain-containing protein n=1 Tax=Aspergillus nanangensis TaxID=2582783 RepID=A0AAD4GZ10_ASPNN|nr:hypothetical protein FE257_006468 [Aspergillus nanangensis]